MWTGHLQKNTGGKVKSQDLDKKIATNIIAFRKSLKLSQRQFALKAEIDQSHINKIEKTRNHFCTNKIISI